MAKSPKLKVFRTAIGFHDAYVAAPSQKAALEAWGSDHNLFARGAAEVVTDKKLTREPLANPGVVLKVLRGTRAEQLAALGSASPDPKPRKSAIPRAVAVKAKRMPRPSRDKLDEVEEAIEETQSRHRAEAETFREKEAALKRERDAIEKKLANEIGELQKKRDREEVAYKRAMEKWRAD